MLYARSAAAPRAQLFASWTVVDSADGALDVVAQPGFDPVSTLVLEEDPGVPSDPGREAAGSASNTDGTGPRPAIGI